MKRKPRDAKAGVFAGGVGVNVALQGFFIGAITLLSYFIGHFIESGNWSIEGVSPDGMTMAFLTLSMTEMFHSFNVRSIEHSVFSMKKQNKYLWGAFVFSFLLTLAVIYLPGSIPRSSLPPSARRNTLSP